MNKLKDLKFNDCLDGRPGRLETIILKLLHFVVLPRPLSLALMSGTSSMTQESVLWSLHTQDNSLSLVARRMSSGEDLIP